MTGAVGFLPGALVRVIGLPGDFKVLRTWPWRGRYMHEVEPVGGGLVTSHLGDALTPLTRAPFQPQVIDGGRA